MAITSPGSYRAQSLSSSELKLQTKMADIFNNHKNFSGFWRAILSLFKSTHVEKLDITNPHDRDQIAKEAVQLFHKILASNDLNKDFQRHFTTSEYKTQAFLHIFQKC